MIRYRPLIAIILIIMAVVASACDAGAQQTGELPTILVLPSLTPTNTHTLTHTPSETFTPSSTPTLTPSFTPSFTPSLTPTATQFMTDTPIFSPTPTDTATVEVTTPEILSFTSSTTDATVGAVVELQWEALGQVARIETVSPDGQILSTIDVPLSGEAEFTIPSISGTSITYRLVVSVGDQTRTQVVTLVIRGACSTPWFFTNPPADAGCPAGPPQVGPGAFQTFQDGLMLYVNAGNRNTIYALANQGAVDGFVLENTYGQEINQWDGITNHCTQVPPAGQQLPAQMFNWMACSVFGPSGFWINTIGFATGPIDQTNRTIQFGQNGEFYINTPSGLIFRFEPIGPGMISNRWSLANPIQTP